MTLKNFGLLGPSGILRRAPMRSFPITAFLPGFATHDSAGNFERVCLRNCGFGCKFSMTLQTRFCTSRTERLESEHVLSLRLP